MSNEKASQKGLQTFLDAFKKVPDSLKQDWVLKLIQEVKPSQVPTDPPSSEDPEKSANIDESLRRQFKRS